jgi:hypothetical protein
MMLLTAIDSVPPAGYVKVNLLGKRVVLTLFGQSLIGGASVSVLDNTCSFECAHVIVTSSE